MSDIPMPKKGRLTKGISMAMSGKHTETLAQAAVRQASPASGCELVDSVMNSEALRFRLRDDLRADGVYAQAIKALRKRVAESKKQ